MHAFFVAYCERLQTLHRDLAAAIIDLPQEALDWHPATGMNSLAILVVHTAAAERYWIGDVVGQESSARTRSEEFETAGLEAAELKKRLGLTLEHSLSILQKLTLADLAASRHSGRDGETYSVAWALAHALEHTALHLGHVQIGRQLWLLEDGGQAKTG